MFQLRRYLVFELLTVDGGPTSPCTGGVTGLEHEVGDYAVEEEGVVVATGGEGGEVCAGFGSVVIVEFDYYHALGWSQWLWECRGREWLDVSTMEVSNATLVAMLNLGPETWRWRKRFILYEK